MIADFKRRFWVSLAITVPILLLSPMIQRFVGLQDVLKFSGDSYLIFLLSTAIYLYGGFPFLKGMRDELAYLKPGMMTLIGLAISVAYFYSSLVTFGLEGSVFFWELATLIDIMLLGHWIEMKSLLVASSALDELARLLPATAHLLGPDGSIRDVPVSLLKVGDRVAIKPGERIPADGEVVEGDSAVDESMLTGESKPVSKKAGARVIGGSINGEGSLTVEVRKTGKDTFLSQMQELVRQAQESKSKTQVLADRAAFWLTIIAIGTGGLTLIAWLALGDGGFPFALERTVTVMVITCPHALGLAVPLVVAVSTSLAARRGLLIRNRAAFEKARYIDVVLFDKTGTLTEGRFGVTDVVIFPGDLGKEELLTLAASVEAHSEHPIARGIVSAAPSTIPVREFRAFPGKGVRGVVNGRLIEVVSPAYLSEKGMTCEDERIKVLAEQGKTVVFVLVDGSLHGAVALADIIRAESKEAVAALKGMGVKCMMLTGDSKQVAKWVAYELGLDEYFAEVLPDEKVAKVKEIQSRRLTVAMTGDGVNDAPALAQADVGIAIGAGTDIALETADIILVRSNPIDIVSIIALARETYRKMVQNLAWATGYNAIAIPLAAGVLYRFGLLLSPAVGAVLMSLSTVVVAFNAQLLRLRG
jgi:Cu2+-exporting ATPase